MAIVSIKDDQLVISLQGLKKFVLFKDEFSVPLIKIKGATVSTEAWKNAPKIGQKEYGADLYGHYFGGVFVQDGKRIFYDLKHDEKAVVIELKEAGNQQIRRARIKPPIDEDFSEIIIGVDSPDKTIKIIEDAIQRQE